MTRVNECIGFDRDSEYMPGQYLVKYVGFLFAQ
jgi:hypothetical protein